MLVKVQSLVSLKIIVIIKYQQHNGGSLCQWHDTIIGIGWKNYLKFVYICENELPHGIILKHNISDQPSPTTVGRLLNCHTFNRFM